MSIISSNPVFEYSQSQNLVYSGPCACLFSTDIYFEARATREICSLDDDTRSAVNDINTWLFQFTPNGINIIYLAILNEPSRERPGFFAYAKTKTRISCAVITQLIGAFVFAT